VSEHLGHSDIAVTGDIYASVLDNSRMKTAVTMEKILDLKNLEHLCKLKIR
jgi:integrase